MPWLLRMLLILTVIAFLLYGYTGWKLDQALAQLTTISDTRRHVLILVVIGVLNLYPIIAVGAFLWDSDAWQILLRGGSVWIDSLLTYPFWIGLIVVAQLLPFFLILDAGRLIMSPFMATPGAWPVWHARLVLIITGLGVIYCATRVYVDTCHIRVNERIVYSSQLAPQTPELRIAHISDVQVDPRTGPSLVTSFVDEVNASKPDLVIFTGDLVTSGTEYIDQAAGMLGRIKARCGVFACLGDHDIWASRQRITRSLRDNGIEVIEDETLTVDLGSARIQLTGVTNAYSQRPDWPRLSRLASGRVHHQISILLTHQPSEPLVEFAQRSGYDLFLAGHTHGGQVVIKYFGLPLTPVRRETRFLSGFYEVDQMLVSVTNGLGLTFAPVRFQAAAEITLLRVVGSPSVTNEPAP